MSKKKTAEKMLEYLAAKEAGKAAYGRADELLEEISSEVDLNEEVKLDNSGRVGVLVDQFADRTVVFKPCGVRRFDLKVSQGKK
jgi:hypothetical protein